jgi:hypothetical protein
MGRIEERIFRLNDEIATLRQAEQLALSELDVHRHLNDDAQRDALVSDHPIDRADARETASDVARFERHVEKLRRSIRRLEAKRDRLLASLD